MRLKRERACVWQTDIPTDRLTEWQLYKRLRESGGREGETDAASERTRDKFA